MLNDEWVSHPTWASEESGFVAHKKNTFEEALHKSEEERHEYHVHIEALVRTIAILEPINLHIDEMTSEDRASYKLKDDFGGSSKNIYHRTIKKLYGREQGVEVIKALQECPAVSVPVVLDRCKQKDKEWRRAQREWSRTWREVDAKNFYKSLDHQGISFKANDKKNITAKYFVGDIETVKDRQICTRDKAGPSQLFSTGSTGHQLEYIFEDTSVLQDALRMVFTFLDHSQALYGAQERRSLEKFIRVFIPTLFMCPVAEFNAACGPPNGMQEDEQQDMDAFDTQRSGRRSVGTPQSNNQTPGVAASDLRKKLLKTAQDKVNKKDGEQASRIASRATSVTPRMGSPAFADILPPASEHDEDIWIRESPSVDHQATGTLKLERRPFFANTTFYTLLRLLQVGYGFYPGPCS